MKEITQNEFAETVKEGFTLVDVYGENCSPCKFLAQTLEVMEREFPFVNIVKMKSEDNLEFCREHAILGVPTLLFVSNGEIKESRLGALSLDDIMEIAGEYLY